MSYRENMLKLTEPFLLGKYSNLKINVYVCLVTSCIYIPYIFFVCFPQLEKQNRQLGHQGWHLGHYEPT